MKTYIITVLIALHALYCTARQMSAEDRKTVTRFVDCVKRQNNDKIADIIAYPLARQYPIPAIKNKREFLTRYNDVFDAKLTKMIINSKPDDWSDMGWRGIMLLNGEVWLNNDENGKVIAINYQSAYEMKLAKALTATDKTKLYPSLRNFKTPVHILETSKFRIRIDELADGSYRYASWAINNKMSDKPQVIISNGALVVEGSGGNHMYEFKNDGYIYDYKVIVMGEDDSPPALLTIYKSDKEILSQNAIIK